MKKLLSVLVVLMSLGSVSAQIKDPVSWTFEAKKKQLIFTSW
ncbi:hypothetical protein [Sediminibacterium salmoneum]|nr:hypothetical protein [Sediminibacterium salmoneum]